MMLFRDLILNLLGADTETVTYASQYFTFIVLGVPFIIVSYTPSNLLRTEGFAFGAQPLIGYNYGAKNHSRLKEILRFCYGFECGTALVLAVILSIMAPGLVGVFMQDASIIEAGVSMLRIQQIGMVFVAVVLVTTCTFQSAGKAGGAFLLSVSRQGVCFAVVIMIMSRMFGYWGVLMAQTVSDFLTAILEICLFYALVHSEIQQPQIGRKHK